MTDEERATGLPASIEMAWGRRARPTKGPKPGLSLDRIVGAAVAIAGTDGLGALSMSRVAADLGTSAMSLYRYVSAKEELLALMVDAAVGLPSAPEPGEGWREGLARWARGYRAALARHRWVVRVPIGGPPITPNQIVWFEDGLAALRETGLFEAEKVSVVLLLGGFVRNEASLTGDLAAAAEASGSATGEGMPGYGHLLARLTDPTGFPALHAAIAAGVFDADDDPYDEFAFGLERILDGIAALDRARA